MNRFLFIVLAAGFSVAVGCGLSGSPSLGITTIGIAAWLGVILGLVAILKPHKGKNEKKP